MESYPSDNGSDAVEPTTSNNGLTQSELDDCDTDLLRVRLLTLHEKKMVVKRLNELAETDVESGKALYRENEELYEVIPLREILEEEEIPESELAFFTDIIYLEDLYSSKVLRNKWS